MKRAGLTRIGTTHGLTVPCDREKPEQLYVFLVDDEEARPVQIEAWVGYSVDYRMRISRRQATDLMVLLAQAIGADR